MPLKYSIRMRLLIAMLLFTTTTSIALSKRIIPRALPSVCYRYPMVAPKVPISSSSATGASGTDVSSRPLNVLGTELRICCTHPTTGFYRDGFCQTDARDVGRHTVCAKVTAEFLTFSKNHGNDLTTPVPHYHFPGLVPGDKWCLCVGRWKEALQAGVAPPVVLESCHVRALDIVTIEQLTSHALPE